MLGIAVPACTAALTNRRSVRSELVTDVGADLDAAVPSILIVDKGHYHQRAAGRRTYPSGIQRSQGPELLGNNERRVVGKHDPTGTDADRRSLAGHVGDDDRRRDTRGKRNTVMLGDPETFKAESLDISGKVRGLPQRRPVSRRHVSTPSRGWKWGYRQRRDPAGRAMGRRQHHVSCSTECRRRRNSSR
jgi:hypothetical protein